MGARSDLLLVALAAVAGCDRPAPLVLCHNANCSGGLDVSRDDTLDALRDSLALRRDGRAPFDGVELDALWHGDEGRCLFAHDFEHADGAPGFPDAADLVADHLLTAQAPSWNGDLFVLEIELKGDVGPGFRRHDDDEVAPHVACALDAIASVRAAALASGLELEAIVDSADPLMLVGALRHRDWDAADALLSADFGAPPPFTEDTAALSDFPTADLDAVQIYPGLLPHAEMEAFRSLGVDIDLWMFTASSEILDAIEHLDPPRVITGEVELMRRWLER
jgi:hypothetical protein